MNIARQAKAVIYIISIIWAIITLTVCMLIYFNISISTHFSFEILLEFSKAIDLWYILGLAMAAAIDIANKKRR